MQTGNCSDTLHMSRIASTHCANDPYFIDIGVTTYRSWPRIMLPTALGVCCIRCTVPANINILRALDHEQWQKLERDLLTWEHIIGIWIWFHKHLVPFMDLLAIFLATIQMQQWDGTSATDVMLIISAMQMLQVQLIINKCTNIIFFNCLSLIFLIPKYISKVNILKA